MKHAGAFVLVLFVSQLPGVYMKTAEVPFVPFVSSLLDSSDQRLVSGFMIDWHTSMPHAHVESAVKMMGSKGTFMLLFLPPATILKPHVNVDWMSPVSRRQWASRTLALWVNSKIKETTNKLFSSPTAFLCNTHNVVRINDDKTILANPNVPVPDWFRCANSQLAHTSQEFRLLPLLKQQSKTDQVYGAIAVTLDEFELSKDLHAYGVKMEQPHSRLWGVVCNYAVQLLRAASDRDVFDFVMFKERTLSGVLLPGLDAADIADVVNRLDIELV